MRRAALEAGDAKMSAFARALIAATHGEEANHRAGVPWRARQPAFAAYRRWYASGIGEA